MLKAILILNIFEYCLLGVRITTGLLPDKVRSLGALKERLCVIDDSYIPTMKDLMTRMKKRNGNAKIFKKYF